MHTKMIDGPIFHVWQVRHLVETTKCAISPWRLRGGFFSIIFYSTTTLQFSLWHALNELLGRLTVADVQKENTLLLSLKYSLTEHTWGEKTHSQLIKMSISVLIDACYIQYPLWCPHKELHTYKFLLSQRRIQQTVNALNHHIFTDHPLLLYMASP